jgi:hypothetical protein
VHSRTVKGALRAVGQAFSTLGCHDPRLTSTGKLDFRLKRQLMAYSKQDPPPHRVKPIPFSIIAAADLCRLANTSYTNTIADMLTLGFYFFYDLANMPPLKTRMLPTLGSVTYTSLSITADSTQSQRPNMNYKAFSSLPWNSRTKKTGFRVNSSA